MIYYLWHLRAPKLLGPKADGVWLACTSQAKALSYPYAGANRIRFKGSSRFCYLRLLPPLRRDYHRAT